MKCAEANAAFGLVQLKKFQKYKEIRRNNIERYLYRLRNTPEIILPDDKIKPNWLAIPLQIEDRLGLLNFLEDNNIQTRVTFAGNVTRHPAYRKYLQDFNSNQESLFGNTMESIIPEPILPDIKEWTKEEKLIKEN